MFCNYTDLHDIGNRSRPTIRVIFCESAILLCSQYLSDDDDDDDDDDASVCSM